jgi:hypothetical protein
MQLRTSSVYFNCIFYDRLQVSFFFFLSKLSVQAKKNSWKFINSIHSGLGLERCLGQGPPGSGTGGRRVPLWTWLPVFYDFLWPPLRPDTPSFQKQFPWASESGFSQAYQGSPVDSQVPLWTADVGKGTLQRRRGEREPSEAWHVSTSSSR